MNPRLHLKNGIISTKDYKDCLLRISKYLDEKGVFISDPSSPLIKPIILKTPNLFEKRMQMIKRRSLLLESVQKKKKKQEPDSSVDLDFQNSESFRSFDNEEWSGSTTDIHCGANEEVLKEIF